MAVPRKLAVGFVAAAIAIGLAIGVLVIGGDSKGGSKRFSEPPRDIAADCSKPVDASLNRFLASVPDGSTVRLPRRACYGIDQSVVLANKANFTLDGAGSTIKALTPGGEQRANLDIRRGHDVSVANLTLEGAYPGLPEEGPPGNGPRNGNQTGTQHGIAVRSLHVGNIRDVRSLNTGGECVAIMSDWDPIQGFVGGPSSDVTVDRLNCRHTGRQGLSVIDGERIVVRKSMIGDAHDCPIDIEQDIPSQVTRQIRIEDNTFGTSRFAVICNGGQGYSPNVGDITVARNTMTVPPATCFGPVYVETPPTEQAAGRARTGFKFIDNTFRTISYSFLLSGANDVEISGNRLEGGLPGSQGCAELTPGAPSPQPGVDLHNVHRLYGQGNTWVNYARVVRADEASTDIGPLTDPVAPATRYPDTHSPPTTR